MKGIKHQLRPRDRDAAAFNTKKTIYSKDKEIKKKKGIKHQSRPRDRDAAALHARKHQGPNTPRPAGATCHCPHLPGAYFVMLTYQIK